MRDPHPHTPPHTPPAYSDAGSILFVPQAGGGSQGAAGIGSTWWWGQGEMGRRGAEGGLIMRGGGGGEREHTMPEDMRRTYVDIETSGIRLPPLHQTTIPSLLPRTQADLSLSGCGLRLRHGGSDPISDASQQSEQARLPVALQVKYLRYRRHTHLKRSAIATGSSSFVKASSKCHRYWYRLLFPGLQKKVPTLLVLFLSLGIFEVPCLLSPTRTPTDDHFPQATST